MIGRAHHRLLPVACRVLTARYSALVWTGMDVLQRHAVQDAPAALKAVARVRPVAMAAAAAIAVTAFSGAFVAGLDAGHAYNDWPWMAERFIPEQIWEASVRCC